MKKIYICPQCNWEGNKPDKASVGNIKWKACPKCMKKVEEKNN